MQYKEVGHYFMYAIYLTCSSLMFFQQRPKYLEWNCLVREWRVKALQCYVEDFRNEIFSLCYSQSYFLEGQMVVYIANNIM